MAKARMTTRGRVTLPVAVLNRLGWLPGTAIFVEDLPEGILLRKAPAKTRRSITLQFDGPPDAEAKVKAALRNISKRDNLRQKSAITRKK